MGIFGDVKRATDQARENQDLIVPEPEGRLDTAVLDPRSGEQRIRTDYAGTAWYGGKPQMTRVMVRAGGTHQLRTPFWLPDSHAYAPEAASAVQIQATAAVQSAWATTTGGDFQIFEVACALGPDPQGSGDLRAYLTVLASASLPFGVSYRVTVVCPPAAIRP